MAELFLQELGPLSLARSTLNLGYDFLVTFKNLRGGTNTYGVEVKSTASPVQSSILVDKRLHDRLTLSNIPGFLLVADVKRNKLFFGWPGTTRRTQLHKIDPHSQRELRKRLVDWPQYACTA